MVQHIFPTDKDTIWIGFILLMGNDDRRVVQISVSQRKYDFNQPGCVKVELKTNLITSLQIYVCNAGQLKLVSASTQTPGCIQKQFAHRDAKCYRYGRYFCVIILEGWGKNCRRPRSFVKWSSCWVNFTNFYVVLTFCILLLQLRSVVLSDTFIWITASIYLDEFKMQLRWL